MAMAMDPPRDARKVALTVVSAAIGVIVLDVFLSLVVWEVGLAEYGYHKSYALTGMYLWAVPIAMVMTGSLIWWPWQPFVWLAALGSAGATWVFGRDVHMALRSLYAVLMAFVVSGFAVVRWSTIGD